MGLMDRDYMTDPDRHKRFRPPQKKPFTGWLVTLFVFVLIVYAGFKLANWLDSRKRPAVKQTIEVSVPEVQRQTQSVVPPQTAARAIVYPPIQSIPAEQSVVTKCVVQGKVSYGDGACPAGAVTSTVTTKSNQNIMAAVSVQPNARAVTPEQRPIAPQVNPDVSYTAGKAECLALEAQIKSLDSMSRQPQGAQMQDWIREERKKARDRQARIPCT